MADIHYCEKCGVDETEEFVEYNTQWDMDLCTSCSTLYALDDDIDFILFEDGIEG